MKKHNNKYKFYRRFPFAELRAINREGFFSIYTLGYRNPEKNNNIEADWYNNFLFLYINGLRIEIEEPFIQGVVLKKNLELLNDFVENKIKRCEILFTEPILSFYLLRRNNGTVIFRGNIIRYDKGRFETNFEFDTTLDNVRFFIYGINKILKRFPPRYKW